MISDRDRFVWLGLVGFLVSLNLGCGGGGDSPTNPPPSEPTIEGTYELTKVNGQELPYLLATETPEERRFDEDFGCNLWIVAGELQMNADNTYERDERQEERCTEIDDIVHQGAPDGDWLLNGNEVTFIENLEIHESEVTGVWDGDVIVMDRIEFGILGDVVEDLERTYRR